MVAAVANPPTRGIASSSSSSSSDRPAPSLEAAQSGGSPIAKGQRGESVTAVQEALKAKGVNVDGAPLTVDGKFGPQTDAAVRGFQQQNGLTVDGLVGPQTLRALGLSTNSTTATTPATPPTRSEQARVTGAPSTARPPPPPLPAAPTPAPTTTAAASSTTLNLPPRSANAMSGSEAVAAMKGMTTPQREAFIQQQVLAGNVPDSARQMKDVPVSFTDKNGQRHDGTLHVMPDYVSIGSDADNVRVPMNPLTAQRIADATGTTLPTRKMVNDVYAAADVRLTPQPMPPTAQMTSTDYFARHDAMVDQQLASRGAAPGALVAGDKKDVVIGNLQSAHPDRVAIYGWHQPNGKAIQPLSTVHENTYADYSHGTRLVGQTMTVDGVERPVADVLADPALSGLVSDEGPVRNARVPRA